MHDHSMFDYLVGSAPAKTTDLDLINEFAKQAASEYLGSSKIPLNHSISKIASVEHLGPDEVAMVCQEANKMVNTALFKTSADKYTDFDLADSSKILAGQEEGNVKVASINFNSDDYDLAPMEKKAYFNDFEFTKTASAHDGNKIPDYIQKRAKMQKLAAAKDELYVQMMINNTELENLENKLIKTAQHLLNNLSKSERAEGIRDIGYFCKSAGLEDKDSLRIVKMLDVVMMKQGFMEKSADVKAPEDLISDNLNARIINGTHPLFVTVKTIAEKCQTRKLYEERKNLIQTSWSAYDCADNHDGSILGQKAKEL
jgi:hypothetical protein